MIFLSCWFIWAGKTFHVKQIKTSLIDNKPLVPFLNCKDYTVSGKRFDILKDIDNELLITTPRPEKNELDSYYESQDYISHTDAKKTVVDRIYQQVRKYTIRKKLHLLSALNTSGKKLLDIGAGTGDFLLACKKDGWKIHGVEPNAKARSIADLKLNEPIAATTSAFKGSYFDVITLWHVLEHLPDLKETIRNLSGMLKPDGSIVVAVPNHKSYDANYYGEFWAAFDVPRHLWHFSRKSMKRLFEEEGMQIVKIRPMYFDSFYVSLLSEKYKTGRSNFIRAFFIGCLSNIKAMRSDEYSSLIYIIKKT